MNAASLTSKNDRKESKGANNAGRFFKPVIQAKLTVNEPGDHYEQEADAMADRVMRMAAPATNDDAFFKPANNTLQRKCQACEDEEKHVHRKESDGNGVQGGHDLDNYVSSLGSSGQSMPESSKSFFEPRFGHDFSGVKIHTGEVAAKSAQSINALAYTTGNNIVFNSGQFAPETDSGKKLMAHELTHVVQQGGAGQANNIQRDTMPAAPAAANCPVNCITPITLFSDTKNCGSGDDFLNADRPFGPADPKKLLLITAVYARLSDADLLTRMKTGFDGIMTLGGAAGDDAANHFFAGSATPVNHNSSTPIGGAAASSDSFKATSAAVEAAFHTIIAGMASTPATNNCTAFSLTSSVVPKVNFPLPLNFFAKDFAKNLMLKAVIGGTHGIEITLSSLTIDCSAHTYEATILYSICDNFGVDDTSDIYADSLASFWTLQHMRKGHKAFINNILLDTKIKKSF
jgi:hypothetical protein